MLSREEVALRMHCAHLSTNYPLETWDEAFSMADQFLDYVAKHCEPKACEPPACGHSWDDYPKDGPQTGICSKCQIPKPEQVAHRFWPAPGSTKHYRVGDIPEWFKENAYLLCQEILPGDEK